MYHPNCYRTQNTRIFGLNDLMSSQQMPLRFLVLERRAIREVGTVPYFCMMRTSEETLHPSL